MSVCVATRRTISSPGVRADDGGGGDGSSHGSCVLYTGATRGFVINGSASGNKRKRKKKRIAILILRTPGVLIFISSVVAVGPPDENIPKVCTS